MGSATITPSEADTKTRLIETGSGSAVERRLYAEIWRDVRPIVRAMIGDAIVYGAILLILSLAEMYSERLHLENGQKVILGKLHFWAFVVATVLVLSGFIIKVFLLQYRRVSRTDD